MMARTRPFKELVQARVKTDRKFAEALLREGIDAMLSGDVDTGKTILRDYIKATVGFEKLGEATGAPPKSLIRMFGPRGNPQAKNLFSVQLPAKASRFGASRRLTGIRATFETDISSWTSHRTPSNRRIDGK
jgi:hypothetical protein